jgi:DNA-binding Lrp family transcriptional regulator
MDELDLKIAHELVINSRITYRKLANKFGISINAVYKRVQKMIEGKVITAFTTKPNIAAVNGLLVDIFGTSKGNNMKKISFELGKHENTYVVALAGGNYLYVFGYLRNISELQDYLVFINQVGMLESDTVGFPIVPNEKVSGIFSSLDYKIMNCLSRNSRKSVSEIAKEIGKSPKTVSYHLKRMIDNHLIHFSIEYALVSEGIIICYFHIQLNEDSDIESEYIKLQQSFPNKLISINRYSNYPYLLILGIAVKSNQELTDIFETLQNKGYKKIVQRNIYIGYFFQTWLDTYPMKMLSKL